MNSARPGADKRLLPVPGTIRVRLQSADRA